MPRVVALLSFLLAVGLVLAQEKKPPASAPAQSAATSTDAYVPYRGHDVAEVIELKKDGDRHSVQIDAKKLAQVLDDLGRHARNYPVRFADDKERKRAERDVERLAKALAIVLEKGPAAAEPELLLLAGRLEAIGHNLDLKESSVRARAYFERALLAKPDDAATLLHFGMHLAGLPGQQKEAIPLLEKSAKLGEPVALRGVGMCLLLLGEQDKALAILRDYVTKCPEDASARQLIASIEGGAKVQRQPASDQPTPKK